MTDHPTSQELLSRSALAAFRLNGQFLALAEQLARPAGLTATRWQVLGAVLPSPLTVSDIARAMGITRQSVQRTDDLLAAEGLVEYRTNPAHARAELVAPTGAGLAAINDINPQHRATAARIAAHLGPDQWHAALTALELLSASLAEIDNDPGEM
ncbi:MarR family winged helix-turn-helix transcriptional regulator [Gordonia sp. L191]|uniref:MarR family winged helix-turn-helix transcriptional regulator n=1 Tax=Gordonia sp. L191 TaxID=2982699 RepID=UPI0024C0282C|nr:MarR family winged helix-turn-helix transcriptional regulator [Gordonia sp. L191]WHU47545.1 MarR family winged helix-turn-helix transcriptional regulator [Gordonia sp. L191]